MKKELKKMSMKNKVVKVMIIKIISNLKVMYLKIILEKTLMLGIFINNKLILSLQTLMILEYKFALKVTMILS